MLTLMHLSGKVFSDQSVVFISGAPPSYDNARIEAGDIKLSIFFGRFQCEAFDGSKWRAVRQLGLTNLLPDHPVCANHQDKCDFLPLAVARCQALKGRLAQLIGEEFNIVNAGIEVLEGLIVEE